MIRLSSGKVELAGDHRPPLALLTLGEHEFGLEPRAAFELAHSMAMIALKLDPSIERDLRERLEADRAGIWTP